MAADIRVLMGADSAPLRRAAVEVFLAAVKRARSERRLPAGLWIAPTQRAQRQIRRRLAERSGGALLGVQILTFDEFAKWLLEQAGHPATPLSPAARRLLLRRITQELAGQNQLSHFRPVVHTSGFLDVVGAFLSELKRDEIWPEEFLAACEVNSLAPERDRELGRIYERYQQVLVEHNWYDQEGRFWLARTALLEGQCGILPEWECLAVVGFADFTRPQLEILSGLGGLCRQLLLTSSDTHSEDSRSDLFAKPHLGRERLVGALGPVQFDAIPHPNQPETFRGVLRDRLFGNPRETPVSQAGTGLEVIAATGTLSERAAVAARIKQRLAEGVRPRQIAIGLRNFDTDGLAWAETLQQSGLPIWCELGVPLARNGLVKFLVSIIQCELEDWTFPRLQTVLNSTFFSPTEWLSPSTQRLEACVRATFATLRSLQLPRDRVAILRSLERIQPTTDPAAQTSSQAMLARPLLNWYAGITAPLRRTHRFEDWIDVLAELVERLSSGLSAEEAAIWDRVQQTLRDAARIEPPEHSRKLDLAAFLDEFRDLLRGERTEPLPEHPGCIPLLSIEQLRHTDVAEIFLVDVGEESFPRRRADDCLFSDAEREHFAAAGLSLRHRSLHQQEELFLFYSVCLQAGRRLAISYSEVDHRGQPTFPSPYVAALRSLFTEEAAPLTREGQLDPIPSADRVLTPEDLRLAAMANALEKKPGWLRTLNDQPLTHSMTTNLFAAIEMAVHRFHTPWFTPYEGRLDHSPNIKQVSERFGTRHQFSATELESYATCPFKFWLGTVLDVNALEDPTEGTDHRRRGSLVHDVLAQLLRDDPDPVAGAALVPRFHELVTDKLGREISETELQQALLRVEARLFEAWAEAFGDQSEAYRVWLSETGVTRSQAVALETPFGNVPNAPLDIAERALPPLQIGPPDNRIAVRGRIDRIDLAQVDDETAFTVIDYKSGRRPKSSREELHVGRSLQLALYALAALRLGLVPAHARPWQLGYWCLKETGFRAGFAGRGAASQRPIDAAAWTSLEQLLEATIPRLVARIRGGEFVVENGDKACTGSCEYRTVCRVNQVRNVALTQNKFTPEVPLPD